MQPFRILHFSDIHDGIFPDWKDIIGRKAMIGACNHALTRRRKQDFRLLDRLAENLDTLKPDLIIFTGDLTSIGTPEEFAGGRQRLLPFLQNAPEKFFYVPGNHDRYTPRKDWNLALAETFRNLNGNRWNLTDLPLSIRTPFAELILLDTARPRPWYLSNGFLTPQDWDRLEELLAKPVDPDYPRIILSHFPLFGRNGRPLDYRRQLNGWQKLHQAGTAGAFQLLLCGHIHHAFVNVHPGYTECCAGSITIHQQYAVIDYRPDTKIFQCSIHSSERKTK